MHPDRLDEKKAREEKRASEPKKGTQAAKDAADSKRFTSSVNKAANSWLNAEKRPSRAIPAGVDQNGDLRVRSGWADPDTFEASDKNAPYRSGDKEPEPTSVLTRLAPAISPASYGALAPFVTGDGSPMTAGGDERWETLEHGTIAPLATGADVVNDVNTRVSNFRRWHAEDPFSSKDDDLEFEYELPSGKTYKKSDQKAYYRMSDGSFMTEKELVELNKAIKNPGEIDTWLLKNGMKLTNDDYKSLRYAGFDYVDKSDKRWDGKTVATDGTPVVINSYELPNGDIISAEAIENPQPAFYRVGDKEVPFDVAHGEREYSHWAFPDGTVTARADGTVPEEMLGLPMRQVDGKHMNVLGWDTPVPWGPVDPRAPWENTAGETIFEKDYWDRIHSPEDFFKYSAANEFPAWFADANLSSAPYYVPRYNLVSGAAAAAPYLQGLQGDTYMPKGRDLKNIFQVGTGDYKAGTRLSDGTMKYDDMTNAQMVGGIMAPLIDALAERFSGDAIGGLEKKLPESVRESAFGKFLSGTTTGRVGSAAVTEGLEEVASSPFGQMKQEGWENLGREYTRNDVTGEIDWDKSTPKYGTMPKQMFEDFLTGTAIGGPIVGFSETKQALKNKRTGGPVQEVPAAPRRTEAELRALERQYRED